MAGIDFPLCFLSLGRRIRTSVPALPKRVLLPLSYTQLMKFLDAAALVILKGYLFLGPMINDLVILYLNSSNLVGSHTRTNLTTSVGVTFVVLLFLCHGN